MASPSTLRLDEETRRRIARLAKKRGVTVSRVIRDAIRDCLDREEAGPPHALIADLLGSVRGGDPGRSDATGRRFRRVLESRKSRR